VSFNFFGESIMKVFNTKTAVRKMSNPSGTMQVFADEGMNLGDVTEMKINPSSMKTYTNQPNVVSLGGLGATDGNGNPITLDISGNDIPNYSDGYPMTDVMGNPIPDPLTTMLSTSGTPLPALTTPTTGSAASLVANFLTSLLPTSITGITKPGAPGVVVAAKPAGLIGGMSATTIGILGLGGLLAFKLLGKKKR
jgi:hypothetical protein